jgi:hypothetical protein
MKSPLATAIKMYFCRAACDFGQLRRSAPTGMRAKLIAHEHGSDEDNNINAVN